MRLESLHVFFKKIGEFQLRHRWLLLILLAAITVFGAMGLKKFRATSTTEDAFVNVNAYMKEHEDRFKELFGSNDTVVLLIEADDVFKPEVLKMIKEIGNELLEKVPYADSVTSIANLDISVGTEEGIEVKNPFEDGIPENTAELKKAKDFILSRKSIVNKIVSSDAKETWLVLSLKATPSEEEWKKISDKELLYTIGESAIDIVTAPKYKSSSYTIKPAGLPYTETEEKIVINADIKKCVSLSFLCMIILLVIFAHSLRGTIVPIVATAGAIVSVLGFMGHLNIAGSSEMLSVPIILAMALSVGYSIHLVNSFRSNFYAIGKRKKAIVDSIENTGWPLFFTVVTTVASVLSFLTIDLEPMHWVGLASAAMVFAVYIYVSILIPILMSFGKDCPPEQNKSAMRYKKLDEFFERFGKSVLKKRKPILVAFALVTVLCLPGIFMINVNMDSFNFMGTRIPYVKRLYEITHSQLGAYFNYNVMITFKEENAVKKPENLKKLEELSRVISGFKLTKLNNGVPKIFSILDVVKEMNQTMHADDPAFYTIPEDESLLAQLLFLYEISGGETSRWVDDEFRTLRMSVDVAAFDGNELADNLKTVYKKCAELFPDADTFLTGAAAHAAEMNNKIVYGELYSFFTSLIVIGILMMIVFGSIKMGLIGLIPNIMPIITTGAIMGYFHVPLDMVTMALMPMILGIAVDDTIHFTNHTKYLFEKNGSYDKAITDSFYSIGKTLGMTTIILSATFLMYLTSQIDAFVRLGILASVGLFSALVADYLMTPVLIYVSKPFGKEKKSIRKDI